MGNCHACGGIADLQFNQPPKQRGQQTVEYGIHLPALVELADEGDLDEQTRNSNLRLHIANFPPQSGLNSEGRGLLIIWSVHFRQRLQYISQLFLWWRTEDDASGEPIAGPDVIQQEWPG